MLEQAILNDNINLLPGSNDAIVRVSLRVRRKTSSQWMSYSEVIPIGEPCYATDTGEVRVGDGINLWSNLQPSLGIHPDLYIRETIIDANGTYKQYTRIVVDDGELV